jgi:membrane-associated phospholipid phosphatase
VKFFSTLTRRGWLWLLAGVVVVASAFLLDDSVDAALDVTRDLTWKHIAWWCSKIGEGWLPAAVGILFSLIFLFRDRPGVAAKIFFAALVCEITGLAATILRVLCGRTRPLNHDVAQGFYGLWHDGHWIAGQFKFSAFPSGHAATAVGLAAAAWLVHRGWGAVLSIYALAVMWSRIALQAHHLSDVLASMVLSIALAVMLKPVLLPLVEFQSDRLHRAWRKK